MSGLFDLTGKAAVVTGSSRGLGRSFALALAKAGADVAVTSRNVESLSDICAEIEAAGSKAYPVALDVRDVKDIDIKINEIYKHFGKIDILVNNAGCNIRERSVNVKEEQWDTVIDTILKGSFFVARACAEKMIPERSGHIINIGSVCSVAGYSGVAPYCSARGGIKQMTMSLADDWGEYGITVNCLAPGWFNTHQTAPLFSNKEWVDKLLEKIPLNRTGNPGDLDGAVVFLASDASNYMTGQTMLVDGGITVLSTPEIL
jgi:gluconate 5-dehydrogenase